MTWNALLANYRDREVAQLAGNEAGLRSRGKISDFRDLYPELSDVSDHSIAYCRGLTPLPLLLLLYDKIVLHIPPLPKEQIEARYGLSMDSLWQLIIGGVVLPVINNPSEYSSDHLIEFVERQAPSVWMRGVTALGMVGLGDTLKESYCPLPVDQMARLDHVRNRFALRYPNLDAGALHDRVKSDILVNYADLCIFGHEQFANALGELGEPQKIFDHLYVFSEMIAYPQLFGFGGTANYDLLGVGRDIEFMPAEYGQYIDPDALVQVNPTSAKRLLKSIGVEMEELDWKAIVDFHASDLGQRLRDAMKSFENEARSTDPSLDDVQRALEFRDNLDARIQEAIRMLSDPRYLRSMRPGKTRKIAVQVGAAAVVGGISFLVAGPVGAAVGAAAPFLIEGMLPETIHRYLTPEGRAQLRDPAMANLWSIREAS